MTKYREILRLHALGLSQQNIANSCSVSKETVNRVLKRARELNISWPLEDYETDPVLAGKLFPAAKTTSFKRMSRNIVLPCISTESLVNRLKLIGQVTLLLLLTQIQAKL